jgi:hypothetical protein
MSLRTNRKRVVKMNVFLKLEIHAASEVFAGPAAANGKWVKVWDEIKAAK